MTPEELVDRIVHDYAHWLPMGADETLCKRISGVIANIRFSELVESRKVCPCECHSPALQTALGIEEHENCGLCAREMKHERDE